MSFLSNATGRDCRSGGPTNASMASATSALRMRADVDCSRISVRAVRSHNPSRKATVGSVAPSHLAPCLTRWRREGWDRRRNPLDHLRIPPSVPHGEHFLYQRGGLLQLLVRQRPNAAGLLQLQLPRHQQDKQFQKYGRLVPHHLLYRLAAAATEGKMHSPSAPKDGACSTCSATATRSSCAGRIALAGITRTSATPF